MHNLAQADNLWSENIAQAKSIETKQLRAQANKSRSLHIDRSALENMFSAVDKIVSLTLPLPNGLTIDLKLTPSSILSADLAAKYPTFMSYRGQQVGQPENIGRFSISHLGLFGFFRYQNKWMLLSPKHQEASDEYLSYWYQDATPEIGIEAFSDDILYTSKVSHSLQPLQKFASSGDTIRTYRLAIATTGEYTQKLGGTANNVIAELMNLVNRINQILLVDLGIQFELIDNTAIIFFDAQTDPFTNQDISTDIDTNQSVIDDAIGKDNYDLGHLLGTNGGGLAVLQSLCDINVKAKGYTGLSSPQGERFYIDLVAHEFGHQLGANHSFNAKNSDSCSSSQRENGAAYEPGSGSTIMAYAGICDPQNLQNISDPYFHAVSMQEINNYLSSFPTVNCGVDTVTNNAMPNINILQSTFTIAANTPFVLTATATDTDDDPLTFSWEQFDNGGALGGTSNLNELNSDNGFNPLFRSFSAVDTGLRYLPKLSNVIAGQTSLGETYATTDRNMRFRLTVRDNRGGVAKQDVTVNVVTGLQSFSIDTPTQWQGLANQNVTWQVADSNDTPLNCSHVDILLDSDGQQQFDITLASQTVNDGSHQIIAPNVNSDKARLMLKCSDNVFYSVTNQAYSITKSVPISPVINGQNILNIDEDTNKTIEFTDLQVTDPDSSYPEDFTLSIQNGDNYSFDNQTLIPDANYHGLLNVNVIVNDGQLDSDVFTLEVSVTPINDAPIANDDRVSIIQGSATLSIDVLANDTDVDNDQLDIVSFNYNGQGVVNLSSGQLTYTPNSSFTGTESATYVITDGNLSAQGMISIQVNATSIVPPNNTGGSGGGSIWLLSVLSFLCFSVKLIVRQRVKGSYE